MCLTRNSSDANDEIVQDSPDMGEETMATKDRFLKLISDSYEKFETTKLYKYFYITGITLFRKAKRVKRRAIRFLLAHKPVVHLNDRQKRIMGRMQAPLLRAKESFNEGFKWSVEFS